MPYVLIAFLSAFLFGSSTPIGKILLESVPPFQLAGLLYLGAAVGSFPFFIREQTAVKITNIGTKNRAHLVGAICFGGIIGPVLLLYGLQNASAASVAMWLNLELVATAILGHFVFKEYLGRYGSIGVMGAIAASVLLSWQEGGIGFHALLLVGGASICWGLDNHLTALIDGITPSQSTFWKGAAAGTTNLVIGVLFEPLGKEIWPILLAMSVGVFAYGFSISLYIVAAQNLGATRSQMIFSSAPFFGVILSIPLLGETLSAAQLAAGFILTISLYILFRDQHAHLHEHQRLNHNHGHDHDDPHHDHAHSENTPKLFHRHWHTHKQISHAHPHWPDLHHRHNHSQR
jgi:drug/metabolite transporter (DMT)-like permease